MCVNFVGLISNNFITIYGEENLKFLVFLFRCCYLPKVFCLLSDFGRPPRRKMRSPVF